MNKDEKEEDINEAVCDDLDKYLKLWESAFQEYYVDSQDDFDLMAVQYANMKKRLRNTYKILEACDELNIDLISVGRKTRFIYQTKGWPFKHTGSLFTRKHKIKSEPNEMHTSPAVWEIPRMIPELRKSGGASNGNQTQIDKDVAVEGVYLKRDGEWCYVVE